MLFCLLLPIIPSQNIWCPWCIFLCPFVFVLLCKASWWILLNYLWNGNANYIWFAGSICWSQWGQEWTMFGFYLMWWLLVFYQVVGFNLLWMFSFVKARMKKIWILNLCFGWHALVLYYFSCFTHLCVGCILLLVVDRVDEAFSFCKCIEALDLAIFGWWTTSQLKCDESGSDESSDRIWVLRVLFLK